MASDQPFHLSIVGNQTQTVVSLSRQYLRGNHQWKATHITFTRSMAPPAATPTTSIKRPSVPVITAFIVVVILAASISPVALMLVVLLTAWFTFGKRRGANSVSTSSIEGRQGCLALNHPHDRLEFDKLIDLAQRIDKNIPMLTGLVDRNEAGEALARALWQAAGLLGRRRKIYSVIDELSRHEVKRLGEGSRVARDLQAQQSAAEELLKDLRVDLDKLMANLTATAEAGDDFRREREALRAVERASQTLAELATSSHEGTSAAADRLAEETVTVVRAYRELNELYGGRF